MPLVDPQVIDHVAWQKTSADAARPNDSLLRRARALLPAEKLLVELAFKNQLSHRQIGQILGVPAGTVTRRLQRICARLRDPMILTLLNDDCPLEHDARALAIAHFLHKRSAATLARQLGRSEREISRVLDYVRGWHRGITQAQASS